MPDLCSLFQITATGRYIPNTAFDVEAEMLNDSDAIELEHWFEELEF